MLVSLLVCALTGAPPAPPPSPSTAPAVREIHGRGVAYVDAGSRCALAALGGRAGDRDCLRIALDDDNSSVTVDPDAHTIVVKNLHRYPAKEIIGDVLLPGWSEQGGARSPTAAHVMISKKGDQVTAKVHAHAVTRTKATHVQIVGFEILADAGKGPSPLLSADKAQAAVADPGLAAKLADELIEVEDSRGAGASGTSAGSRGDITVALGLGPAAKKVSRAQLTYTSPADSELKLTALSGLVPTEVIRRDLFLYGLEGQPLLADIQKRGLKAGESLTVSVKGGKGAVSVGGQSSPFDGAASATRAFLEGSFMGVILAHQAGLDTAQ